MLNNMKYFLETFLFNNEALGFSNSAGYKAFKTPLVSIEGAEVKNYNSNKINEQSLLGLIMATENEINNGVSIRLGTGASVTTTEETYCLENEVTTNFTLGTITSDVNFPNGKVQLVLTAQYTNNTDQEITINEVGFGYNNSSYAGGWTRYRVLLDRKSKADGNFTPVTIGAGESKIFVYALEL